MDTINQFQEMDQDELRSSYDAIAQEYEQKLWFDQYVLGVARMRNRLMSKASGKILDVACGTGLNFPSFSGGCDITAVDLSPRMLEMARQKASRLGLNVNMAVMDAENLDFPDGNFDTVVSALSTCTFPDPVKVLREMRRVCKYDGLILLLEHGHSNLPWLAKYQDRHVVQHFQDNAGCRWNQDPLNLVRAAGLKIVRGKRAVLGMFHSIEAIPIRT